MTATEALKFIDEIEWCSLCRINKHCSDEMEQKCEDMRKTVVEALEKQAIIDKTIDKYKWHDLRKDPEDLPVVGSYLCINDLGYCVLAYFILSEDMRLWFYCKGNKVYQSEPPIAWRYIEPFTDDYIMPENSDHRKQRGRTAPNEEER